MLLALVDRQQRSVAHKTLETDADFRRVADASVLVFQGTHYKFSYWGKDVVTFMECSPPVIVDGFVTKLPQ